MKMKRMTKQELIDSITEYETLLNNKAKIRKFKKFPFLFQPTKLTHKK